MPHARMLDPGDCLWDRVTWAQATTPGDRVVGELVEHVGPGPALRMFRRGPDHPNWRELVSSGGLDPEDLDLLFRRYRRSPSDDRVNAVRQRVLDLDLILVGPDCPEWPARLNDLGPYRPLVLFAQGRHGRGNEDALLAIVGSRTPTSSALSRARDISNSAIDAGYVLVSGGALGVDWAVHTTAVRRGAAEIMVVATPLDRLATWQVGVVDSMATRGLIISEAPPGKAVSKQSFLHRNRLIAALADRVIVVEAAERSGTLNTASHAKKLGRDLSAVIAEPPTSGNAGCYRLVDQWGADRYVMARPSPQSPSP